MNRILLACVIGLLALVAASRLATSEPLAPVPVSDTSTMKPAPRRVEVASQPLAAVAEPLVAQAERTPTIARLARMESRRRLIHAGAGMYLDSLFTTPDSMVRRWGDRAAIVVAIEPSEGSEQLAVAVRAAFRAWEELRLGLTIVEARDTAGADVVVTWIKAFEAASPTDSTPSRTGLTELRTRGNGEIQSARITLSREDGRGAALGLAELRAVATHEFGHALGLPHSGSRDDIMYPTVIVPRLSERDRSSIGLLYGLPSGPLREP